MICGRGSRRFPILEFVSLLPFVFLRPPPLDLPWRMGKLRGWMSTFMGYKYAPDLAAELARSRALLKSSILVSFWVSKSAVQHRLRWERRGVE